MKVPGRIKWKSLRRAWRLLLVTTVVVAVVTATYSSSYPSSTSSPTLLGSASLALAISTKAGSSNPALAAARAAIDDRIKVDAGIGPTTKLSTVPLKGKTVYFIAGNIGPIQDTIPYLKQATAALGWKLNVLSYTFGDAEGLNAAIEQAVSAKADFIATEAVGLSTAGPGIAQAKAAGIPFYEMAGYDIAEGKTNGVYADAVGLKWQEAVFGTLLDYSVVNAGGPTGALLVGTTTNPSDLLDAAKKEFLSVCSSCDYKQDLATPADLADGAIPGEVVSLIQSDPKIKYVFTDLAQVYSSLRQGLDAAGMKKVKILTVGTDPGAVQAFNQRVEPALVPYPLGSTAWALVDAMARDSIGQSYDRAAYDDLPFPLWTQQVRPASVPSNYPGPTGYQQAFRALWRV
jgi:ABC-type sugar transport system substrate-binding protein